VSFLRHERHHLGKQGASDLKITKQD